MVLQPRVLLKCFALMTEQVKIQGFYPDNTPEGALSIVSGSSHIPMLCIYIKHSTQKQQQLEKNSFKILWVMWSFWTAFFSNLNAWSRNDIISLDLKSAFLAISSSECVLFQWLNIISWQRSTLNMINVMKAGEGCLVVAINETHWFDFKLKQHLEWRVTPQIALKI